MQIRARQLRFYYEKEREREDGARLRFYAGNIHEIRTIIEVLPTEIREL